MGNCQNCSNTGPEKIILDFKSSEELFYYLKNKNT